MGRRLAVGHSEADAPMALPATSDSAIAQADWVTQADADVDPLPLLKRPAAQGVHAVETAAAE